MEDGGNAYGGGVYDEQYGYGMKQEYGGQDQQVDEQQQSFGAGLAGQDTHLQGDKWRQAFLQVAAAAGLHVQQGVEPQPESVLQAVQGFKQSEDRLQAMQQQEAALQVQVAHLTLQNLELRRELGSGWAVAEPNVVQARQLILDPAIQVEFAKLRRELEDHKTTIAQLREQNESLTFTAESKTGRQLITKTKLLIEENTEMAQQLREGPAATQGALLAVERHHASELRKGLSEVKDHCSFLEEENEELNMLRFLNERQIQDLQGSAAPVPHVGSGGRDDGREGAHHSALVRRGGGHMGGGGGGRGGGYSSRGGRGDSSYGGRRGGRGRGDGGGRFAGHKRMR